MKWYEDPVYIKMADCPEIQGQWKPKISEPDYYCHGKIYNINFLSRLKRLHPKSIWLPTQSQLQAMVKDTIDCSSHSSCAIFINVGHRIRQWCDDAWDYWMQFTSMEQLWLAFVMKELHHKVWNGSEWVL